MAEQKTILMLEKELAQYNTENGRYDVNNLLSKIFIEIKNDFKVLFEKCLA